MLVLTGPERDILTAFYEAHTKTEAPDHVIEMRSLKWPKEMNGPQKLEIIRSLRTKGIFENRESTGIRSSEQLTDIALEYIGKRKK